MTILLFICSQFFAIPLIVLVVGGLILLSKKSNMLRDEINDPVLFMQKSRKSAKYARRNRASIPRPFSLARTQFAFWTAIITSSYIYLMFYRHCGIPIHFDASTLAMLGISVGTTMGGIVIDKQQGQLRRHQNAPSKGFFIDILSDENGVSIARFQQVVWTFIAGVLYITQLSDSTLPEGQLPKLDSAILLMSGLSNAAYLSLKMKENTGQRSTIDSDILEQNTPAVEKLPVAQTVKPGKQIQPQ
jgi:hypothetical protein